MGSPAVYGLCTFLQQHLQASHAVVDLVAWCSCHNAQQHSLHVLQDQEFVRPGFELGYEEGGKFYVKNHLQFNILVHPTHGEYMRARQGYKDAAMLENIDARRLLSRRQLLDAGMPAEQLNSVSRMLQADAPAAGRGLRPSPQ